MMVHAVEDDIAGRPAERFPLPNRLFIDFTIHDNHH